MNKVFFSFLIICCHTLAHAGNGIDLNRRNAVYFEGGGGGFLGSVNYERIFYFKDKPRICARIGFALHPDALVGISDAKAFFLTPIGVSVLAGDEKNFFEGGLTWTHDYNTYKSYVHETDGSSKVETYHDDYFFIYVGYRYHARNGFLFRASLTPALSFRTDIHRMDGETADRKLEAIFWAGVSLGYIF